MVAIPYAHENNGGYTSLIIAEGSQEPALPVSRHAAAFQLASDDGRGCLAGWDGVDWLVGAGTNSCSAPCCGRLGGASCNQTDRVCSSCALRWQSAAANSLAASEPACTVVLRLLPPTSSGSPVLIWTADRISPRTSSACAIYHPAVHTIPVQASESFLRNLKDLIPVDVPIVCCSKGLHTGALRRVTTASIDCQCHDNVKSL